MSDLPQAVRLLLKLWAADSRFIPTGIHFVEDRGGEVDYRWEDGITQSGHYVDLELFHNWTQIDQQAVLEAAVGKIFSLMADYNRTVIQIQGNQVAVKHTELREIRRFKSQRTMVANLFNALIKMVEVEWLPMILAKDSKYYYTEDARLAADHAYECILLIESKNMLELKLKECKEKGGSILPPNDPFANVPHLMVGGGHNTEIEKLKSQIAALNSSIENHAGAINRLGERS